MGSAQSISRLSDATVRLAWLAIVLMVVCALLALATGLGKGNGNTQVFVGEICAGFALFFIILTLLVNVVRRESPLRALAAFGWMALLFVALGLTILNKAREGSNRVP